VPEPWVDVWCLHLSAKPEYSQTLATLLSPDERQRAASFHAPAHRQKFEVSRGVLRLLLGRYLGTGPHLVEFEYGAHGKPALKEPRGHLEFNVAHSGEMAIYAVGALEVGIDIEQIRHLPDLMSVARRFFSAAETIDLASLSGDSRIRAFHNCWARKEAYIKALGTGLSLPLESFRVSLLPGQSAQLLQIEGSPGLEAEWLISDLAVDENYAAALAVRVPEIRLWTSPLLNPEQITSALNARLD
jgi:4'-phosphopantetheinyl transferase